MIQSPRSFAFLLLSAASLPTFASHAPAPEEVEVIGQQSVFENTDYSSVRVVLDKSDFEQMSMRTIEDSIAYAPGLVVRRRFVGDPNGVIGMRGANMFQTARTMVFVDGLPLHYFLQTRWSGAPRWSLVGPEEASSVEVVYGPFSAEYSGNAMGGVVNIQSSMPEEESGFIKGSWFVQDYDYLGTDEGFDGGTLYAAYGNRSGIFSYQVSFNHLENEGHPQSIFFAKGAAPAGGETPVTGVYAGDDSLGKPGYSYGDTGPSKTTSDLLKFRFGLDLGSWKNLATIALEEREILQDGPNNYLRDASGNPVWNGNVTVNGQAFNVKSSRFQQSERESRSLLVGLASSGPLTADWSMETHLSHFDMLEDEEALSAHNEKDPAHNGTGTVSEYDDTGWDTLELKWHGRNLFGQEALTLLLGLYGDEYRMNYLTYASSDYDSFQKGARLSKSGGETALSAAYAQLAWQINHHWDTVFGIRQERWETDGDVKSRSDNKTSPKLSVGYQPDQNWNLRYSIAKAYRFPIAEELYKNEATANSQSIANIDLEPENGLHQSLSWLYPLQKGMVRFSLFHEKVEDTIFNQTAYLPSVTINTFLAVDEVTTQGAELQYAQKEISGSPFDLDVNLTWTDAEITKNSANPATEGNEFPRIPEYRLNILGTWHITDPWDASAGVRYASDTYDTLENSDTEEEVFGAQDNYLFLNLKTSYQIAERAKVGFGVDNVTNEKAFVAHPWPQRTWYIEASYGY